MTIASPWSWVIQHWQIVTVACAVVIALVAVLVWRSSRRYRITASAAPSDRFDRALSYSVLEEISESANEAEGFKPREGRQPLVERFRTGATESEPERGIEQKRPEGLWLKHAYGRESSSPERSPSPLKPANRRERNAAEEDSVGLAAVRPQASHPLEIEAGRLTYQIPSPMWLGLVEAVEVRLGRFEAAGLMIGFLGRGEVRDTDTPIVERMTVTLSGKPDVFAIHASSPAEQLVMRDAVRGTPFEGNDFARWQWLVTPLKKGKHQLIVKVSGAVRDSHGQPVSSSLPDKEFPVRVKVRLLRSMFGTIGGGIRALIWTALTALVGAATKDIWWPFIRAWLQRQGFLP